MEWRKPRIIALIIRISICLILWTYIQELKQNISLSKCLLCMWFCGQSYHKIYVNRWIFFYLNTKSLKIFSVRLILIKNSIKVLFFFFHLMDGIGMQYCMIQNDSFIACWCWNFCGTIKIIYPENSDIQNDMSRRVV